MNLSSKQTLRRMMKKRRALLAETLPLAGKDLAASFFQAFPLPLTTRIGGYWPFENELDVCVLMSALSKKGFPCALPCVEEEQLVFRSWTVHSDLTQGLYGIQQPFPTSPLVVPDVLLVPLLAFDGGGYRLGYGRGFYDRYLAVNPVLSIGISFSDQEVEQVPRESHDIPLDYVLTETGLIKAGVDRS